MKVRIELYQDPACESPLEENGWKLHSFSSRHGIFAKPESLGLGGSLDHDGWPVVENPGLRRKLQVGTAFWVSCYQHSGIQWGLPTEVYQCPWDTARVGGILIWTQKPSEIGKTMQERRENARGFLGNYTAWCNGQCYGFSVDDDTEFLGGCSGFILGCKDDADYFFGQVGESVPEGAQITWEGNSADLRHASVIPWLKDDRKIEVKA